MQAASIGYRVADFLKQHPPFQFLDSDALLELAMSGRVKFHEGGERVYEQGRPRGRFVFVIQQGCVEILTQGHSGEELRDLRGEGDLLGLGAFLEEETHRHTARTAGDVLLYALPRDAFETLARGNGDVRRYLAAALSLGDGHAVAPGAAREAGLSPWIAALPLRGGATPLVTCPPDLAVRDVARRMQRAGSSLGVVVDDQGRPLGCIRDADLRGRVATGELPLDAPARQLMTGLPTAPPGQTAGEYLLTMLRERSDVLALTADGGAGSPVESLVVEQDAMLCGGNSPLPVRAAIERAPAPGELRELRERSEALLLEGLAGLAGLEWHRAVASELHRALLERSVALAEAALAEDGAPAPDLPHCWLLLGAAGRDELLTRFDLDVGLVYADPGAHDEAEAGEGFRRLGERVAAALAACGFERSDAVPGPAAPSRCLPLSGWGRRFEEIASDPITSGAWRALACFDLQPACGDRGLVETLRERIVASLAGNDNFVPLLANDSLAHLPPLTFFQGLVVDGEGVGHETLDLWRSALQPLVDMGRVLALERRDLDTTRTSSRLEGTLARHPEHAAVLREAGEAFRVALFHQARGGLRRGDDGSRIGPAELTRYDQQLLKAGFRSIAALLELTASHFGLHARR